MTKTIAVLVNGRTVNRMADNELFGNSEQLDTISRAAAINAIYEDGTQLERQRQYTMTMAERKQRDADILDALPSAKPVAKDTNVPVKDCISRRAAVDALAEWHDSAITNRLNNLPTVDAVPVKHGRWTMAEGELAFWDVCSECGKKILHRTPYYDFCPNCGARMDGKDGDNG